MFGLVTLAGTAVAVGYRRFKPDMPTKRGDRGFVYREVVNSKTQQQTRVQVAVPVATLLEFDCKPETWFDRTCKAWGLAVEHQARDARFDDAVYVLSDDARLRTALLSDPALREALVGLFKDRMFAGAVTLKRVRCRDGMLMADYRCGGGARVGQDRMGGVAERLKQAARLLPPKVPNARIGDSLLLRSILVLALSTALAITGGANLFRLMLTKMPFTVDAGALFAASLTFGMVALCLMVLATMVLVGRSSRLHLVLLEVCLVGGFGAVATGYTELRDANIEFDHAAPVTRESVVVDKDTYRGRRGRRSYYLEMADWNDGRGTRRFRVPGDLYKRMTVGERAQVMQHPGWLGMRWVSDIRPASE
jgi:hypothetical protein